MMSAADPNPTFLTVGRISAFSPDGSRLSFTRQDEAGIQQVWFYYFDTGQATQVTPSGVGNYGSTTWSPDGTQIATFYVPGQWFLRLATVHPLLGPHCLYLQCSWPPHCLHLLWLMSDCCRLTNCCGIFRVGGMEKWPFPDRAGKPLSEMF